MTAIASGLCAWCHEPLVEPRRSTRRFCDDTCRHKYHAAKTKPRRSKGSKLCACNGSHIPAHDEDGGLVCGKCSAPIEGTRVANKGSKRDFFAALMEVPFYRASRPAHIPWRSTESRTTHSTEIRVYTGEPFKPDSAVEIRPASSFRRKRKSWGRI